MGLFSKTEEELKQEEINKKFSQLINYIWMSDLENEEKQVLIDYVNKIKNGRHNDFGDLDTLIEICEKLTESTFFDEEELQEHLKTLQETYRLIVDKDREDYERLKALFIQDFVGTDGCIYLEIFDEGMYAAFTEKKDYLEILHRIMSDETLKSNSNLINEYANNVSKYCLTQDMLKRDILSYMDGLKDVLGEEYKEYSEEELDKARRRIGIYNVSPKVIAEIDSKLRRIDSAMELFNITIKNAKEEEKVIDSMIASGKKEISNETKKSLEAIQSMIDTQKQGLMKKLDQYLLDLEDTLKDKSDETFRQIIITYQEQVQEFRELFKGYSAATSKDLMAIQKATEESVKRLQDYVSTDPELSAVLQKAEEQRMVREKVIQLVGKEEELIEVVEKKDSKEKEAEKVTIPGYEQRIMVPYRHMQLPSEISTLVNPLFDESIPFSKRKEILLKRIEQREKSGEIFHKKVKQIAIDMMEGDWPYLWGPSGTGKSYMAKQVASLFEMELTKAGKITEPYSILGYNDPQGRYQITPSFVAALYGNILFLDEMDNGNPDTQVVLNDIYSELLNKLENPKENSEVTFGTDIRVDIHPNFRMISAGNTTGEGENQAFSSRGKMDESIQERMTPIFIDYDNRVEEKILTGCGAWYKFFINFREACMDYAREIGLDSAQGITTTRDAAALKKYILHNSKTLDQIMEEKFIQIKDYEYRKALGLAIASMYGLDYGYCDNPKFTGDLKKADGKTLAKKFVYYCKEGVE